MNWIGYTRVSRVGDREDTLISPELQAERIRQYAEGRGIAVDILPPELDVSGGETERPILSQALQAIDEGRSAGIVVAQLDRLSRMDLADALKTIDRVESAGGQVIAVAENFDAGTPEGRMGRNVFLAMGQMQLDRYKLQFRAAKAQAVARGIWPMSKVPLGYRKGPDRRLVPGPGRDRVVRGFEARASGAPWSKVARAIGGVGMSGAAKIARNRVYLGELRVGDLVNPEAHEPLISRDLWEAAQIAHPRPSRGKHDPALLRGVVHCAACGFKMTPSSSVKGGYVERIYRCTAHNKAGSNCSAPAIISQRKLDAYVEALALAEIDRLAVSAQERTQAVELAGERLATAEAELAAYQRVVSVSELGEDTFLAGMQSRMSAVNDAREALSQARLAVGPLPLDGSLRDMWDDMSPEERGHVLRGALSAVFVSKGRGACEGRVRVFAAGSPAPSLPLGVDDLPGEVRPPSTKNGE